MELLTTDWTILTLIKPRKAGIVSKSLGFFVQAFFGPEFFRTAYVLLQQINFDKQGGLNKFTLNLELTH